MRWGLAFAVLMIAGSVAWPGDSYLGGPILTPIPTPGIVASTQGRVFRRGPLHIGASSRIVVTHPSLHRVALGLGERVWALSDLEMPRITGGDGRNGVSGDIVLSLDPGLAPEAYEVRVGDRVWVTGGGPVGVTWGLSAIFQVAEIAAGSIEIPRIEIADRPVYSYRALEVDVASRPYSIADLKELILLCHTYRIRFLTLGLGNDKAFVFPVPTRPALRSWRTYREVDLRALVAFAETHGVTVVPSISVPFGSRALITSDPATFESPGGVLNPRTLHMGRDQVYQAMDGVIGALSDVFAPSPYVILKSAQPDLDGFRTDRETAEYLLAHDLKGPQDLYPHFLSRVGESILRNGKRPVVGEAFGVGSSVELSRESLVLAQGSAAPGPRLSQIRGYELINQSDRPLRLTWGRLGTSRELESWTPEKWDHEFRGAPTFGGWTAEPDGVRGGQMQVEGLHAFLTFPLLRSRVPLLAEALWTGRAPGNLATRLARSDGFLQRLVRPADLRIGGRRSPEPGSEKTNQEDRFTDRLVLRAEPFLPGDRLLMTTDGSDPEDDDLAQDSVILLETGPVRFRVVDAAGKLRGRSWLRFFEKRPVELTTAGLGNAPSSAEGVSSTYFIDSIQVRIRNGGPRGRLTFTVDGGAPSAESPPAPSELTFKESTSLRVGAFSEGTSRDEPPKESIGEVAEIQLVRLKRVEHMATGAPVRVSSVFLKDASLDWIVDGIIHPEQFWEPPMFTPREDTIWVQVDLGTPRTLTDIRLWADVSGGGTPGFELEGSLDGRDWEHLASRGAQVEALSLEGLAAILPVEEPGSPPSSPTATRWVRLRFLDGLAGERIRFFELALFGESP